MVTAHSMPPVPTNEPVRAYGPGSREKAALKDRLDELAKEPIEAPCVIAGRAVRTGTTFEVRAPHRHDLHLATVHAAGELEVEKAIEAALYAKHDWAALPFDERAAVFLKAAELLAGPWRDTLNAATMLGQSKTAHQAEIDAACELIDFWRFNVRYAAELLGEQPESSPGVWNRLDHRPLEGFVLAITPFNFTSIAGNLPTAPAILGNTVVWKPSEKQAFSAHFLLELLRAAGLPDGVINLVHGDGAFVSDVCFDHPEFAGLHFTGSTAVLQDMWRRIGAGIHHYRSYPRIVGETGGKDFVLAHRSADPAALVTALVRGAFEYQGQKCSAASRAYIPRSLWEGGVRDDLAEIALTLPVGDVTDFRNFMGAVIEQRAFAKHRAAIAEAREEPDVEILVGGGTDDTTGWFVEPTVFVAEDPTYRTMCEELFGPILTVHVYADGEWEHALDLVDDSAYGLTGAVFAIDRAAIDEATARLRDAAGNFYVNDKPTGAVVGQQPFGGGRGSGTNDKAGSPLNLLRWTSVRSIKETFDPATDYRYPYMDQE